MQNYPVRAQARANLNPDALERILRAHFGAATVSGDVVTATYGAIEQLRARVEGKELGIDLRMNPKVPDEVARDTIARYNRFLEEATGYSAKERAKRLRKSATAGD